ncbi:MAG: class I SAM-dependent methyltransferase [Bacteroidia bacterium]
MSKSDYVTDQAREMYNEYGYGEFSYGDKREKYESLLRQMLTETPQGTKVYDIGCATGYWFGMYMRHGIPKENIHGIDLTPQNISRLQEQGFNAQTGDVLALDLPDNVSGLTICNGVIHHTPDPYKAFTELVRITKPGGYIYLNVYNAWNPYFYVVHRATWPLRYAYWNWSKKTLDIVYPVAKLFFQPISYLVMGQFIDDKTGRTMFMDQVMTPRAALFTKSRITSYARKNNCEIKQWAYNRMMMMISAKIKVLEA